MRALAAFVLGLVAAGGCAQVDSPTPEKVLPADYKMTFVQVRDCRSSVEHDLAYVVVRARPEVVSVYNSGPYPFAAGTLLVKEQYADARCAQLSGYTVMRKEAGGSWAWYRLDRIGTPIEQGKVPRCIACHETCTARDQTCSEPQR
jgi:hypothetical protein